MDPILLAVGSVVLNGVLGLLAYFMRDKINKVEQDLKVVQDGLLHVQVNYAQKSDMDSMKTEILGRFDRLEDKLDRLQ